MNEELVDVLIATGQVGMPVEWGDEQKMWPLRRAKVHAQLATKTP